MLVRAANNLGTPSWMVSAAQNCLQGGVLMDRIPGIVAEAMQRADDPETVIEIDLAPYPQMTALNRQRLVSYRVDALLLLARYYEKLGETNKAHEQVWQARAYVTSKAPAPDVTDTQTRNWYSRARFSVLSAMAVK